MTFPVQRYPAVNGFQVLVNGGSCEIDFNEAFVDAQLTDGSDIICDLSHFSTVVIAGGDATEFLQGQFTNDVNKVDDSHSQISAFCNNKGRMIANFRLFQYQQNYFISIRTSLVDKIIDHLQSYVLRAQVAIQDVSEQLIHLDSV